MHIHIALVGGQTLPVYLGISSEIDIDKIFFVCSEESKDEVERIYSQCQKVEKEIVICHATDLNEISRCAEMLYQRVRGHEISFNLTGGTKPWALAFYEVFRKEERARFLLVNQNNRIYDLQTHLEKEVSIDAKLRFELYGTPLRSYTAFSLFTEEDIDMARQVIKCRRCNMKAFGELTENLLQSGRQGYREDGCGSSIEWDCDNGYVRMEMMHGFKGAGVKEFEFECEHACQLISNNAWFELFVAKELSKNRNVREIWMNCEFKASTGSTKNEVDIILDMGSKLFFVECKTRIFDTTDLDKFHSVIKNFSGTSSKGIFVSLDAPTKSFASRYKQAMEKCYDNKILTFNFGEWWKSRDTTLSLEGVINQDLLKSNLR